MKTGRNLPRMGEVKRRALEFIFRHFGRRKDFSRADILAAGWDEKKDGQLRLYAWAKQGYLKKVKGKKRYLYLRGLKAKNGQVVSRKRKTFRETILPPIVPAVEVIKTEIHPLQRLEDQVRAVIEGLDKKKEKLLGFLRMIEEFKKEFQR